MDKIDCIFCTDFEKCAHPNLLNPSLRHSTTIRVDCVLTLKDPRIGECLLRVACMKNTNEVEFDWFVEALKFCGWVDTNDAQHSEIRKLWATLWPQMAAREKGKE